MDLMAHSVTGQSYCLLSLFIHYLLTQQTFSKCLPWEDTVLGAGNTLLSKNRGFPCSLGI